jgi:hypothetical protein
MRREQAVTAGFVMPEHLASDYRAISGLDAPMASRHSSAESYTPPDPRLVEQVEMVGSGASTPNRAFPGEEDFSVESVGEELAAAAAAAIWGLRGIATATVHSGRVLAGFRRAAGVLRRYGMLRLF